MAKKLDRCATAKQIKKITKDVLKVYYDPYERAGIKHLEKEIIKHLK